MHGIQCSHPSATIVPQQAIKSTLPHMLHMPRLVQMQPLCLRYEDGIRHRKQHTLASWQVLMTYTPR